MSKSLIVAGMTMAIALGSAGASQAAALLPLGLHDADGVQTEMGQVLVPNDIKVTADEPAIFHQVKSKVKHTLTGQLYSVTFTPITKDRFDGLYFKERAINPDQTIFVTVKDRREKAQTFSFTVADNSAATPLGVDLRPNDALKWVKVSTVGGFQKVKDIQFSTAGVPEPAAWTLMTLGVGLIGGSLRLRRRTVAIS
ncbi:MAG TPA: PEP-CTERM sorting domain-containing protein [Caulobacteraceae bacterium]|nr:PEP-CTERM sorting domain-containing protein [Caulobacteraceae bacterium]